MSNITTNQPSSLQPLPPNDWIPGYQKSVRFGFGTGWTCGFNDFLKLYFDNK